MKLAALVALILVGYCFTVEAQQTWQRPNETYEWSDISVRMKPRAIKALAALASELNKEVLRQTGKKEYFDRDEFQKALADPEWSRTLAISHWELIGISGAIFEGTSEYGSYKGFADFTKGDGIAVFIPNEEVQKNKFMAQNLETLKVLNKRAISLDPFIKLGSFRINYPNSKILGALRENLSQSGSDALSMKVEFSTNEIEKSVFRAEPVGDYFLVRGQVIQYSICLPFIALVNNENPNEMIMVTGERRDLSADDLGRLDLINAHLVSSSTDKVDPKDGGLTCHALRK